MRVHRNAHQKLGIVNIIAIVLDALDRDWIHMMNNDLAVDRKIRMAQIASRISYDHFVPGSLPLFASIERLIQISLKSEGTFSYLSTEFQVFESVIKRLYCN